MEHGRKGQKGRKEEEEDAPNSDSLQPNSDGLQPKSLQPSRKRTLLSFPKNLEPNI